MYLYLLLHFAERKPATRPAGSNPLQCSRFQPKSTSMPAGKGPGRKSIAAQSISAIYTPKSPGQGARAQEAP